MLTYITHRTRLLRSSIWMWNCKYWSFMDFLFGHGYFRNNTFMNIFSWTPFSSCTIWKICLTEDRWLIDLRENYKPSRNKHFKNLFVNYDTWHFNVFFIYRWKIWQSIPLEIVTSGNTIFDKQKASNIRLL